MRLRCGTEVIPRKRFFFVRNYSSRISAVSKWQMYDTFAIYLQQIWYIMYHIAWAPVSLEKRLNGHVSISDKPSHGKISRNRDGTITVTS